MEDTHFIQLTNIIKEPDEDNNPVVQGEEVIFLDPGSIVFVRPLPTETTLVLENKIVLDVRESWNEIKKLMYEIE